MVLNEASRDRFCAFIFLLQPLLTEQTFVQTKLSTITVLNLGADMTKADTAVAIMQRLSRLFCNIHVTTDTICHVGNMGRMTSPASRPSFYPNETL